MIVNKMGHTITHYDLTHRHIRFIYFVILCLCGAPWYINDVVNFEQNAYEASLDKFVSRTNWMLVSDYGIDLLAIVVFLVQLIFLLSFTISSFG